MCEGKQPAWLAEAQARRAPGPRMGEEQGHHTPEACVAEWAGSGMGHYITERCLLASFVAPFHVGRRNMGQVKPPRGTAALGHRQKIRGIRVLAGHGPSEGTGAEVLRRLCEGVTAF